MVTTICDRGETFAPTESAFKFLEVPDLPLTSTREHLLDFDADPSFHRLARLIWQCR
jgi:hypothetical protein